MGQAALIQALVHQPLLSRLTDKGLGGLVWFRGGCFVLRFWFCFPQKTFHFFLQFLCVSLGKCPKRS